jgi:hypothetical protein
VKLPPLPRPLIVVLVIIIVLSVVGCGVSLLRGGEQGSSDPERQDELRNGDVGNIFSRLAPPSEPLALTSANTSCLNSSGNLQFTGTCTVTIPPTDDLRRQLLLRPTAGSMGMQVSGFTNGEPFNSNNETVNAGSDDGSLVLARNDFATVTLNCPIGCTVLVNPT